MSKIDRRRIRSLSTHHWHMDLIVDGNMFDNWYMFPNGHVVDMVMMDVIGVHVIWHVDDNVLTVDDEYDDDRRRIHENTEYN